LGVHCCGNTDWSIFADIPAVNIINFDAYNFQEKFVLYAKELKGFLKRGGIICWGIVPTQAGAIEESPASLANKIKSCIDALVNKGVERSLLNDQMFISPSCGLGTLKIEESEMAYNLLRATSLYIKDNF
jgi:methionine synthase II (cobalamin-independent)